MPRIARRTRAEGRLGGRRLAREAALELGRKVREARLRRGWSLAQLGVRIGLTGQRVGQIEQGEGHGASLEVWFALSFALGIPLKVELLRDRVEEPADAGHLAIQELVLRLGRETGRGRTFELPTRPSDPSLSVDVGLRDDERRLLMLNECWNTFANINASIRSTHRKIAEAQDLAVAIGGERGPYRVAACWIVRDTRRNREIIARYPEVFGSTFTGSSRRWVAALTRRGVDPPDEPGLVWCDLNATRLFAWRR